MLKVFGPSELQTDVLAKGLCVGCGACIALCPYFKSYRGRTSMVFPCTHATGRCQAYCPKSEFDFDVLSHALRGESWRGSALGEHLEIRVAKAGKRMPAGNYQSGGTVSALIICALEQGMIDGAVLTDRKGLLGLPRLARQPYEIMECATSKYMASPTLAALNRELADPIGRVGLVATPCQAMAVAKMRLNPLQREDFREPAELVVGLFCTWALDTRLLLARIGQNVDPDSIRKMDIPPPPAELFQLHTGKGIVEIPLNEIRPLIPAGCHICPDMTAEWADISAGVLEGREGWNTLVIRTEKGKRLVDAAIRAEYLTVEDMPGENLAHLEVAAMGKKRRAVARALEDGLLNTDDPNKRSAMRMPVDVVDKIKGN